MTIRKSKVLNKSNQNITAVLGPTNTGKTHLAVERMLANGGGMIGLPLRLLAREIYDRVRAKVGDAAVALVTGEEKIIPAAPRYWVCTVEAMPPDIDVPFLAIDEIQLCADFERGHIFTDRLLNRRGREETMLLGAASMRPIIEQLLPGTIFVSRPRFSKLTYSGQKKLTRLPRRSAIVAFSADMVYAVAELIKRQRGGAAVVMGSLSPRTRNAQAALYQSGDVDYLVATDAIGMGINMDVDHVAFAATRKFDGFQFRSLNPGELGQVAGRAGRYMNDGTFGVTGESEPFDQEMIDRLENHNFDTVKTLQWRNRDLDMRSLDGLRKSLGYYPKLQGLTRAQSGPDILALDAICRDDASSSLIKNAKDVELAWEACQIPDYRNISEGEHAHLVGRVIQFLKSKDGYISEDWFIRQLRHCEKYDGDLDTLSTRISHIRTWTFIANRANWLKAPSYWQASAKEIEDKLSDALHERLTQRFIDRKTSVLMRRLAQREELMSTVEDDGAVRVEGELVGHVKGLSFIPVTDDDHGGRALRVAAQSTIAAEVAARAISVVTSTDNDLKISRDGKVIWQGVAVGRLHAGDAILKPRAEVECDDTLSGQPRDDVRDRLQKFVDRHLASVLEPLFKLEESEGLEGIARGIAFRLVETLGVLPRENVTEDIKTLAQEDRANLRKFGGRFGAFHVFVPTLLKPAATDLRLMLWWLQQQKNHNAEGALPTPPGQGLTSAVADPAMPEGFYAVSGYRICGTRVVRVDMLERLADMIRDRAFWRPRIAEEQRPQGSVEGGGFSIVSDMMSLVGCSGEEFEGILKSLGFKAQKKTVRKNPPAPTVAALAPVVAAVNTPAEPDAELVEPAAIAEPEPVAEATVEVVSEVTSAEPVVAVIAEPEMMELMVWWPKDTGPFRKRPERVVHVKVETAETPTERGPRGKPNHRREHGKDKPKGNFKPRRNNDERDSPPPRPARVERPADPLSPFAILAALKDQLKQAKN